MIDLADYSKVSLPSGFDLFWHHSSEKAYYHLEEVSLEGDLKRNVYLISLKQNKKAQLFLNQAQAMVSAYQFNSNTPNF